LDLSTDFGSTKSIPIPTIPTSFYPGATPYSALMSKQSTKAAKARAVDMSVETPAAASRSEQVVQGASQETGQPAPESAGPVPSGNPGPVPAGGNRPSRHRHGHHHFRSAA
jgi:rhamnogalacturonan hydrolase